MLSRPERIRVVCFDAVGTLIYPHPPAAEVYAAVGRRHGSRLDPQLVAKRFHAAFGRQEQLDQQSGLRTSEERERRRWQAIVADVFAELPDSALAFAELWQHFAEPHAWAVFPDVPRCLGQLRQNRFRIGIASNLDNRLRRVLAGLPELGSFDHVAISSELGWRKPASEFFTAMIAMSGFASDEVLLVGDDWDSDVIGGHRAGLQVVYLNRHGTADRALAFTSLDELPALLNLVS